MVLNLFDFLPSLGIFLGIISGIGLIYVFGPLGCVGKNSTVNILAKFSYLCPNQKNYRHFTSFCGVVGTIFVVKVNKNMKLARRAENLGEFHLKLV